MRPGQQLPFRLERHSLAKRLDRCRLKDVLRRLRLSAILTTVPGINEAMATARA
jgi:hypothetical protein